MLHLLRTLHSVRSGVLGLCCSILSCGLHLLGESRGAAGKGFTVAVTGY